MKKNSLLKTLGITFGIALLLSWAIKAGYYSNGTYTASDTITPIGLYNLFSTPIMAMSLFFDVGLLFLAVGGFYGVLNKTGVYSNIIAKIVEKWKSKKTLFLTIVMVNFILLSSLVGSTSLLLILVPFFTAILLKLGYDKVTSFSATFGSILIGEMGSLFGVDVWGMFKYYFSLQIGDLILVRIVFLIMISTLFILLVRKNGKNVKEEEIPLYVENKTKKDSLPLIIISIVSFILLLIGTYDWQNIFGITLFNSFHESIANMSLVNNLLGGATQLGLWSNIDIVIVLLILSIIISWIYSVKFNEALDGLKDGVKEMLLPAFYALMSYTVFAFIYNSISAGNGTFVETMINKILGNAEKFETFKTALTAIVSSSTFSYFPLNLSYFASIFTSYDTEVLPSVAFIFQTMKGIVSLVIPTSFLLVGGLSYAKVSYKEWIKNIWFFILELLIIIILIFIILTIF